VVHASEPSTRGLRWGAIGVGLLGVLWGASLGVRPVLAFGIAQLCVLTLLWLYPRVARRSVSLERTMTAGACEEDLVPVRFALRNRGRLPLVVPEVLDRFTPDKVPRRVAFVHPLLSSRSQATARYDGECTGKRGQYPIGPAVLHLTCPTGLFSATVSEQRAAQLTVYPSLEALPELASGSGAQAAYGGAARRQAGEGDLPLMAREYRAGDSLRRIHWPTTARRGRLTILEYEQQHSRQVAICLDLSKASLRGLGRQSTLEVAVRVAAAVAGRILDQGDRVSLHGSGPRPIDVPPGRGTAQLCRVLAVLATARPNGDVPLSRALEAWAPRFARGQTVLVVVADTDDEALPRVTSELAAGHHQVIAVLLDPSTFPLLTERSAPRLTFGEVADAFLAQGATVYVVRGAQSLGEAFLAPYGGRARVRVVL
jgi:uncharacterized protein (DUF58 family)